MVVPSLDTLAGWLAVGWVSTAAWIVVTWVLAFVAL